MSALIRLEDEGGRMPEYHYTIGNGHYWPVLWVCVTDETVVASVKDNPRCAVCDLRADWNAVEDERVERSNGW